MRQVRHALFIVLLPGIIIACTDSHPPEVPRVVNEDSIDNDTDIGDLTDPDIFYDKFDSALSPDKWERMNDLWGQPDNPLYQHGGVIAENVSVQSGFLVLKALGDLYEGEKRGIKGHAKRLGGVLKSRQRFASGRFEVKMKVIQVSDVGVLSAAWVFWYKPIDQFQYPEAYHKAVLHGNTADSGRVILNHEVDIEVKGIDLRHPVMTNWTGLNSNERDSKDVTTPPLLDNQFHVYRFDWHTGGNGITPEIKYYIDNQLVHSSTQCVPYIAGHFYVGNWFGWWAGNDSGFYHSPAFSSKDMLVDWVKITRFKETNDDWLE